MGIDLKIYGPMRSIATSQAFKGGPHGFTR
jgi:hypothetical protein